MLLTMLLWQSILTTLHLTSNALPKDSLDKTPWKNDKSIDGSPSSVEISAIDAVRNEELKISGGWDEGSHSSMYCDFLSTNTSNICGPCACVDERRLPKKYYCDCRNLPAQQDCLEFRQNDYDVDGIYKVTGMHYKTVDVFCDQTTDGGGWTVFQRRLDGTESFHRDWEMYKVGFGDLQFEHYLGNEHLHKLMLHALYSQGTQLRVDLMDWNHKKKFAQYDHFQVDSEFAKYEIHVGGYNGTAGDALSAHNTLSFSTIDRDNDLWTGGNCAQKYFGGWWYAGGSCVGGATLNHNYYQLGMAIPAWYGIVWTGMNVNTQSLKRTEMKFRRKF